MENELRSDIQSFSVGLFLYIEIGHRIFPKNNLPTSPQRYGEYYI